MTRRLMRLAFGAALASAASLSFGQVGLQNATATFSQTSFGIWNASEMIDGDLSGDNGWAIFEDSGADRTNAQSAVFETVSALTAPGLAITMIQNYPSQPGHLVGRFRWSYTTDSRDEFADGLQTGGDVTANWTVMTPSSVTATGGVLSTVLGDGSVLMDFGGAAPINSEYVVSFLTPLTDVTGFRLEVLPDASLPTGGPGSFGNGNFVITEVEMQAVPEPATLTVLALGAAALLRRRRKAV